MVASCLFFCLQILFIGEAVQIFQTQNTSSAYPPLPSFSTGSGSWCKKKYTDLNGVNTEFRE